MTYGYIRVSTEKQTVENQRFEILRFAQQQGLTVDGWIEETISGTRTTTSASWAGSWALSRRGTSFSARSCPAWVGVCL